MDGFRGAKKEARDRETGRSMRRSIVVTRSLGVSAEKEK